MDFAAADRVVAEGHLPASHVEWNRRRAVVSRLLELHDDLLAGSTGRSVNGVGALLVIVLALTGIVVWWPGIKTWRRSLIVHRNIGWRRFTWDLHSMIGFWAFRFIALFGLSGAYLAFPQAFQDLADRLEPPTGAATETRIGDQGLQISGGPWHILRRPLDICRTLSLPPTYGFGLPAINPYRKQSVVV